MKAAARAALFYAVTASFKAYAGVASLPETRVMPMEEILVTAEQPGPGMWRVTKNGHELWIFGTLAPLPKQLRWHSQDVEQRIAASELVLAPPQVSTNVGLFRSLTLLPSLLRARRSPDGLELEQSLPHDVYIRWLALRVKYGLNSEAHKRPMLAALELYAKALDQYGLVMDARVWDTVEKLARKRRVPVSPVAVRLSVDDPKAMIRDLAKIPRAAELACFTRVVDGLEADLDTLRRRADSWAVGDVEGLHRLGSSDQQTTCRDAFFEVTELHDRFAQAQETIRRIWLDDAHRALAQHAHSFAVVPISECLDADGFIEQLRRQGYQITTP